MTDLAPLERAVKTLGDRLWVSAGFPPGKIASTADFLASEAIALPRHLRTSDPEAFAAVQVEIGMEGQAVLQERVVAMERWSRYCQTEELLTRDKPWEACTSHVTFGVYRVKQPGDSEGEPDG